MSGPAFPDLDLVFRIDAEIDAPRGSGPGPCGERLHIPITGGRVHGPRLRGRILPGGSDWALVGRDGHTRVSAHYSIEADDGALIYVQNHGLRVSPPDIAAAMRAGEIVATDQYYFRAAPRFDVGDGAHQWLRESLFISSIRPFGAVIEIDVFAVT